MAKGNVEKVRDILTDANNEKLDDLFRLDDDAMNYDKPEIQGNLAAVMYVHQIPELIKWRALDPGLRDQTICILGPSAIGKTDGVRQGLKEAAEAMGRPLELYEKHVSQMVVTDVLGVPRDDGNHRTTWYPPQEFALQAAYPDHELAVMNFMKHFQQTGEADYEIMKNTDGHAFPFYTYFWDEVTNPATPSTVHQCFSLWMGNRVGGHKLVSDAMHILAGNRVQDGTNSINLAKSAVSRLTMIEAVPSLAGWMANWALKTNTINDEDFTREHPTVIAYLHKNSSKFAPNTAGIPAMTPYPSPRTWSFVSKLLYANDRSPMNAELLRAQIAGHIGTTDAQLFYRFMEYWEDLPDVNWLLNSPKRNPDDQYGWMPAQWPKDRPDVLMIMITQMIAKLRAENAQRFMAFMMDDTKFPQELSATAMKMLKPVNKLEPLAHKWASQEFAAWSNKYSDFMF